MTGGSFLGRIAEGSWIDERDDTRDGGEDSGRRVDAGSGWGRDICRGECVSISGDCSLRSYRGCALPVLAGGVPVKVLKTAQLGTNH
jgi:hypothetical protein